jgi:hypothetical protein
MSLDGGEKPIKKGEKPDEEASDKHKSTKGGAKLRHSWFKV